MYKSKLIRTLRKLGIEELKEFREFVSTAYFNPNKELQKLMEIILAEDLVNREYTESEDILKKMFPRGKTELRRLSDLLYALTNLLEEFLSLKGQNRFQKKLGLLKMVYEKDLDALVHGIEKDLNNIHDYTSLRDSNFFYESFMIHSERDYGFRLHGSRSDNESLQLKSDTLDLFYFSQKLKDACEMLNQSRIISVTYHSRMIAEIIAYIQSHPEWYAGHAAIQVYLHIYLMFTTENHEEYFYGLKKLAAANDKIFTTEELRSIYGYAQNYCIRRLNQGNTDFLYQLFEIYKHIMETGLVFVDNLNMQWELKNFVSIGLRLKEYDWTYSIIHIFKDRLPEEARQNAYTYNLANYYYETGEYKKATKLLNSVEFTDIYYHLDSKVILLKIYYKLEEDESFYALVSSFGIYLRRNKLIAKDTAEVYNNLLRFTKKAFILQRKMLYERGTNYYRYMTRLKSAISRTPKIANINWLTGVIEALENRDKK